MERYNPDFLYRLGIALSNVQRRISKSPNPFSLLAGVTEQPVDRLEMTFDAVNAYGFLTLLKKHFRLSPGCLKVLESLLAELKSVYADGGEIFDNELMKKPLKDTFAKDVSSLLSSFETHFYGDCMEQNLYLVPAIQAYDTRALLEEGERLLPESVVSKLITRDKASDDTKQAARCLAFELWTAMGFHIARATESLIHEYYEIEMGVKVSTLKNGDKSWGHLVSSMKASKKGDAGLLDHLAYVGTHYRNPISHPEETLDETSGPLLLAACTGCMALLLEKLP